MRKALGNTAFQRERLRRIALRTVLHSAAKRLRLTHETIADGIGLTRNLYSRKASGERPFSPLEVARLIDLFRNRSAETSVEWSFADEFRILSTFVLGPATHPNLSGNIEIYDKRRFELGGFSKEAYVYSFVPDLEGYQPNLIHCSWDDSETLDKPPSLRGKRFDSEAVQSKSDIKKNPKAHNGRGYTLSYINSSRTDKGELPTLTMRFKRSDYVRRLTTRRWFSNVLSQEERQEILEVMQSKGVVEAYCGGFGAVMSIITADNKLLFFRRSKNVGGDHDEFDCTVTEASNAEKDDEGGAPSPMRNALRALKEEAFLEDLRDGLARRVRFHAVLVRAQFYEWAIYGSLDLRGAKSIKKTSKSKPRHDDSLSTNILGTTFRLAQDAYEFDNYVAVPFTMTDVVDFICTNRVTEYGFANAVFTLISRLNVSASAIAFAMQKHRPAS